MIRERWFASVPGRRFVIGVPYLWLLIFFVVPFLILLRISVTDMGNGIDPFAPLVQAVDGILRISLNYQTYLSIFEVTDDAEIGDAMNRRVGVGVDRDDSPRRPHARHVLNGAGNADSEIQLRRPSATALGRKVALSKTRHWSIASI